MSATSRRTRPGNARARGYRRAPGVNYETGGKDKRPSESKVENAIEESVAKMAGQIDQGRSPSQAARELNFTLDMVAPASQPEKFEALEATIERQEAEFEQIERHERANAGW